VALSAVGYQLSAHAARFTGPSLLARQAFGLAAVPSRRLHRHRRNCDAERTSLFGPNRTRRERCMAES